MKTVIDVVREMLNDDILSRGLFVQTIHGAEPDVYSWSTMEREVLRDLLSSGEIEVGQTASPNRNYVEFIAWRGTVDERIDRAIDASASANAHDKEFAYWLCLRRNIDRFEGE
jgi:hypothetical protein